MSLSHPEGGTHAVHSYHFDLHMKIAEYARCRALRDLIERSHILTFNWFYDAAAHREPLPPAFHRDLIAGLASGDPVRADKATRAHVQYGRDERVGRLRPAEPAEWRGRRRRRAY